MHRAARRSRPFGREPLSSPRPGTASRDRSLALATPEREDEACRLVVQVERVALRILRYRVGQGLHRAHKTLAAPAPEHDVLHRQYRFDGFAAPLFRHGHFLRPRGYDKSE